MQTWQQLKCQLAASKWLSTTWWVMSQWQLILYKICKSTTWSANSRWQLPVLSSNHFLDITTENSFTCRRAHMFYISTNVISEYNSDKVERITLVMKKHHIIEQANCLVKHYQPQTLKTCSNLYNYQQYNLNKWKHTEKHLAIWKVKNIGLIVLLYVLNISI